MPLLVVFWGLLLHVYRPDTQRILVDIGLGFHVEFTWSEALKFISLREEKLERYMIFLKLIKQLCLEVLFMIFAYSLMHKSTSHNLFVSNQSDIKFKSYSLIVKPNMLCKVYH